MFEFEWDSHKSHSNKKKHGVAFEEACEVFRDDYGIVISDPDNGDLEERFLIMGMSHLYRLLVVCFCHRGRHKIRIISARKATKRESKNYRGFE